MVCTKCSKLTKTTLATPEVKKRSEIYHGSLASSSKTSGKKGTTLANSGISKVRLLAGSLLFHLE